jgi:predicted RNase H-like HicB family nuclease
MVWIVVSCQSFEGTEAGASGKCGPQGGPWDRGLASQKIGTRELEWNKHFFSEGNMELTAVYIQVPEGYIAFVEELPGANTQGDTLEEARENLREAVEMVLEANRE